MVLDGIGQHWRPLAANANLWKRVWPVILDGIGLHFRVVLGWYWVVLGGIGAHLARVVSNIDNQTQWATRMCRGQVGQKGIGGGPTSWYIKLRACRSAALPLPCVQNVRFASVEFYAPTSEALLEFYPVCSARGACRAIIVTMRSTMILLILVTIIVSVVVVDAAVVAVAVAAAIAALARRQRQ